MMIVQLLILILGFALLIKGADWLVDGASSLARRKNISNLAIGLTIVAFGTSAPEMVVSVVSSIQNHQDIVFGNIIGSNNFNLFVILGIAGLLAPITVQSSTVWKEIPLSFFAILLLFALTNTRIFGEIHLLSRIDGVILLVMFGLFLTYVYKQLKTDSAPTESQPGSYSTWKIVGLILIGLAGLVAGGRFVVTSAVELARALDVSEKIIGLTIVAGGTSLPELATSIVAAMKKNNDIAVGNIIGSNIFNIFFILGISSIVRPIAFDPVFNTDIYLVALGTFILFLAMFTGRTKRLDRWEAVILLMIYVVYTYYLLSGKP